MSALLAMCCLAMAGALPQSPPEKLIEEGHWKQARAIVEPWYRQRPDDPLANFLMSQVRNAFHDRQTPLGFAERAVQLDGSTAKFHRQLAECLGVEAQHSGTVRQLFLARRFKKEIDIALSEDPKDLQALRDLLEFYLLAGIAGGDKSKAREIARQIGRFNPAEGYLAEARIAEFDKDDRKVEALFRKAVESQPGSYKARIALAAFALSRLRNQELATQQAREAVRIDRGRVEAYAILAEATASAANWSEMNAILAGAEREIPDDLTPAYRAAVAISERHRELPRAERLLRKYLGTKPEGNAPTLADAHWQLGLVMEQEGQEAGAVAEWREAVRLDPDSPARKELKRATGR